MEKIQNSLQLLKTVNFQSEDLFAKTWIAIWSLIRHLITWRVGSGGRGKVEKTASR